MSVTPLSGAYPVVTLGFAWAMRHERPSALQWAGIVSVLAGMVLTTAEADELERLTACSKGSVM